MSIIIVELWLLHTIHNFAAIENELELYQGLQNFHGVLLAEKEKQHETIYNKILVFCNQS